MHAPRRLPGFLFTACHRSLTLVVVALSMLMAAPGPAKAAPVSATAAGQGDFPLVAARRAAPIIHAESDAAVVGIAVRDLAADIEQVTGVRVTAATTPPSSAPAVVIVGTLGKNPLIDRLVAEGRFDASALLGQWESFVIAGIDRPLPGVERGLLIVGSDRRGTAYGVYDLSQSIGVSPWHWWADVTPARQESLFVTAGMRRFGPPSVKYRGIFINDEDWGLQRWAARTFEPEHDDIGPRTYAKVFELLLRLKANTLWPAMHPSTRPFNHFPENARLADAYAIVMGSSHAEPMLRNNVGEWTGTSAEYNYLANRDGVHAYWEDRLRTNGRFENIYTIGMRGIHDSNMVGPRTDAERIATLERIFVDQRALLERYALHGAASPQMFCAYKEVLDLYRHGLTVPDDVTIVWPDDNFGYIRDFASAGERTRSGGFGVYYHVSYLGRPLAYLWLNTTPPALIWEEMTKAYDHGADRMWIVNVGDIKPAEIAIEFFLQLGWDVHRWDRTALPGFLPAWAAREFGPEHAVEVAAIMDGYYRLNFARKPEHLQWWLPGQPVRESPLSLEEAEERMASFAGLVARVEALNAALPEEKRDAFFQLVLYPVVGAARANERYFHAEAYGRRFNLQGVLARGHAARARAADRDLTALTARYNNDIAGGKWRHVMALEPADNQWRSMRMAPLVLPSEIMVDDRISNVAPSAAVAAAAARPAPPPARSVQVISASAFTRSVPHAGAQWQPVPGLGRGGDAVAVFPTTARSIEPAQLPSGSPRLEYAVTFSAAGAYRVTVQLVPTHPLVSGRPARLAISVGDGPRHVLTNAVADGSEEWAQGVLANAVTTTATVTVTQPGVQTFCLHMVDAGVVVEAFVIEPAPLPGRRDR